ncbi:MAG: aminotransferase class I/II-fold pyridoxal phosphate-dependent enzyme [Pseudomonadales bacterium]|nr:aminotransferase class I/II-fold pyridoxal phosphate-dependent enzyme [Pseudomonadales bacterium]
MYRIGDAEIRRIQRLIESGRMFRYGSGGECAKFEADFSAHVGVKYTRMASSGTAALHTALVGLGIGPGDQVIVPAYTYVAVALAVLAAGAIPVIADVDESLTLSAKDLERRLTKHTRAVIPVHMVGLPCDMAGIMKVARKHKLKVLEDACLAVGGGYRGKKLGSIGHAGAFSFNVFKNITCGEGGAFVTRSKAVYDRGSVAVDCCAVYWEKRPEQSHEELGFAGNNFRASEFQGAILNAQLSRLEPMLKKMRSQKKRLLAAGEKAGLRSITNNSLDYECGSHVGFLFSDETTAREFSDGLKSHAVNNFMPMDMGPNVYTRWKPIMREQGAHHPALDPFKIPANRKCKVKYSADMCADSLDILARTVLVGTHPDNKADRVRAMASAIRTVGESIG